MTTSEPPRAVDKPVPPAPCTLHASLARAVADGRTLLETDTSVTPRAGVWHEGARRDAPLEVGPAGAVMAMTLGIARDACAEPSDFAPRWRGALHAIDRMNVLDWAGAWTLLYGETGPPGMVSPSIIFADRIEAAAPHPSNEAVCFTTQRAYEAWLDHIEHEVLKPLRDNEEALSTALEPIRPPEAPETLAGALRVALADGWALADEPRDGGKRYMFYSGTWHYGAGEEPGACVVCAAGSVMAGTLRSPPDATLEPSAFAQTWTAVLQAIEAARTTRWRDAFGAMHGRRHPGTGAFEHAMRNCPEITSERGSDFLGREQYVAWLEHIATVVLPVVAANEALALAHH